VTTCGLLVTTYERPDALARVLESVAAQSRLPDELIVADDGSGAHTATVIRGFAATASYAVHHVWQPHEGFRAGRARNLAIARARCDYLLLIDGDMVLDPRFIADHLALARRGRFSQGVRIRLDATATRRLLVPGSALPGLGSAGLGLLRRTYALRSLALAQNLREAANRVIAVKACNQGFWRDDLVAVNGFDETMTGWGAEDKELCARLSNAGIRRQTLLFAALAWHLGHPPADRLAAESNAARWRETVRSGRTRCPVGLDAHLAP
jgi:glycosyltransferase involved in cell wall biosynthesis